MKKYPLTLNVILAIMVISKVNAVVVSPLANQNQPGSFKTSSKATLGPEDLVKDVGMKVLKYSIKKAFLENNEYRDMAKEWKVQLGIYDVLGDWPFNSSSSAPDINGKVDQVLEYSKNITQHINEFSSIYNYNEFSNSDSQLSKLQDGFTQRLNYLDNAFNITFSNPFDQSTYIKYNNAGKSMRSVPNFDKLITYIRFNDKNKFKNYLEKLVFNITPDQPTGLENIANELTGTLNSSYSSLRSNALSTNFIDTYFLKYFAYINDYSKLPGGVAPWLRANSEYSNSSQNAILSKAQYNMVVNTKIFSIMNTLQDIFNLQALSIYIYYKYDVDADFMPSYINKDSSEIGFQTAMNKLDQVYFGMDDGKNGKIAHLLAIGHDALELFPKLPEVKGLPQSCLQPEDVAASFSLADIEKSGVYWNGYGASHTGELSTMCEAPQGEYVSASGKRYNATFPIYLNVDKDHPDSSTYCTHILRNGRYLYCTDETQKEFSQATIASCSTIGIKECKNYTSTGIGFTTSNFHIDSARSVLLKGGDVEFNEETLTYTGKSLLNALYSFSEQCKSRAECSFLQKLEVSLNKHTISARGNYEKFSLPIYWANSERTKIVYPSSISFNLYFKHDGRLENCPVTIRPGYSEYKAGDVKNGKVISYTHPYLTGILDDNVKQFRCGSNGQFKLTYNPEHIDTINIGNW